MPVQTHPTHLALDGVVGVEDAEPLLQQLREMPLPAVDLSNCTHLHAAGLQVLLAVRPRLVAPPVDPFLAVALAASPAPEAA